MAIVARPGGPTQFNFVSAFQAFSVAFGPQPVVYTTGRGFVGPPGLNAQLQNVSFGLLAGKFSHQFATLFKSLARARRGGFIKGGRRIRGEP